MAVRCARSVDAETSVVYGHDHFLGYFCIVHRRGKLCREYDRFTEPNGPTVAGVLKVLVEFGFFDEDHISAAMQALEVYDLEDIPDEDEGVTRAAEAIETLRAAGRD